MSIRRYGLGQEFRGRSGLQPPLRAPRPATRNRSAPAVLPFLTSDQGALCASDWLGTPSRSAGFSPVADCDAGLPGHSMQRRGLASFVPTCTSLCGTFSKPEFSNKPSPGCVCRVKPQHGTQHKRRLRGLVHVCPDLLGSLADETRGETEQVADGEPSDGAGCSSCRQPCPQRGVWPAGNFMPIDRRGNVRTIRRP